MLGLVKPMLLYMHWPLVIGKVQVRHRKIAPASPLQISSVNILIDGSPAVQLWRLLGTFIYLGPPSFAFLLRILWMCAPLLCSGMHPAAMHDHAG